MAFQIQKIYPLDLEPRKAIGVDLPFSGKAVFNSNYLTKDAIRNNLINYFLTNKGERYLNPSFGSNIRKMLFENISQDTLEDIKEIIAEDLSTYFPRVSPKTFELTATPDSNTIRFYLNYSIADTNIEDELLINIDQ
jgi:phage baseplate assembly protein W